MNVQPLSEGLASAGSAFAGFLRGFGRRVLVHVGALLIAGFAHSVAGDIPLLASKASTLTASTYVGLICLFPRGIGKNPAWLFPTGIGLTQFALLTVLGLPWQLALLWAGAQTWLQRVWRTRGRMGWEWAVSPLLLGGLLAFFDILPSTGVSPIPVWSFPPIALAGFLIQYLHFRRSMVPAHKVLLYGGVRKLQTDLGTGRLPGPLQAPVRLLAQQGTHYLHVSLPWRQEDLDAAKTLNEISRQVGDLLNRERPELWDEQAGRVFSRVTKLSDQIRLRINSAPALPEQEAAALAKESEGLFPEGDISARLDAFRESARRLTAKKNGLPEDLRPHLEGIQQATESILECMFKDSADLAPGEKFLSRYLPAAHKVVDEHIRLSREGSGYKSVEEALGKSGEMLARLEQAFISEHGGLLQNDTMNFTAELNLVDKLLKMQGR